MIGIDRGQRKLRRKTDMERNGPWYGKLLRLGCPLDDLEDEGGAAMFVAVT